MFKILDLNNLEEMGFKKEDYDYVYRENVEGVLVKLFTVYAGSPYLRYARSAYCSVNQLRCIYEWTRKKYIEWED